MMARKNFICSLKATFLIGIALVSPHVTAQKLNAEYRTVADSGARVHYLVFSDESNCKLMFPPGNHGDAMFRGGTHTYDFKYRLVHDTITFYGGDLDSVHSILDRFKKSRFVFTSDEKLFDTVSGYTYVDDRLISDKYVIYVVNGTVYRQRANKVNGYGLVTRSYNANRRLRRKLKGVNPDDVTITVLKGKQAYDKYGLLGINGVFEIEEK